LTNAALEARISVRLKHKTQHPAVI